MFVVIAAGHFPAQSRAESFRTPSGAAVLWGSIGLVAISAIGALYFAAATLPWYAAVIGGGLMILTAPLAVQPLPNRVVDSRAALLAFAVLSLALGLTALQLI